MQPTRSFRSNVRTHSLAFWFMAVLLICGLGAFRLQFIDLKPVHTDEAENAYLLAKDIEGEAYVFNPRHHHGPTLNLWLHVPAMLAGYRGFSDMEIEPLRAAMWALGVLTLVGFCSFSRTIGRSAVLVAIVLAGTSGYLTYFGNEVIHETLLGLLALFLLILLSAFIEKPTGWKVVGIGCIAGLMFSTKITSLFYFASWSLAGVIIGYFHHQAYRLFPFRKWMVWTGLVCMSALFISTLCYTSFFSHPVGIWDAVCSLWKYETEPGHAKNWSYFLTHFVLPIERSPFASYEIGLWGFAALAVVMVGIPRFSYLMPKTTRLAALFLLLSAVFQILLYTLVSYKTPWLLLTTWLHVALLAGIGFSAVWRSRSLWIRMVLLSALIGSSVVQIHTTYLLNAVHHSDPRNPLAYAPTSANIRHLPVFLRQQLQQFQSPGDVKIAVFGSFIWPVPWYLREFSNVSYAPHVPAVIDETVLILTDESYEEVEDKILEAYHLFPYTLRPNVPVYVCVSKKQSEGWED